MSALIYQPDRNPMQSGRAKTKIWILEFDSTAPRTTDVLTGWVGSDDTQTQVRMKFATINEAKRYAERHGIEYRLIEKTPHRQQSKSYSENFSADRKESWTH